MALSNRAASAASHPNASRIAAMTDLLGIAFIVSVAVVGYFLFPDNLSLLTRIISLAFLVLSLDLVTGFCGVATLGHAALFGAGAYGAGIAAAHFGVTDPIVMIVVGVAAGAVAGFVSGIVMLRGHGLAQLVLSIAIIHLFHEAANKASTWTGGSDGLTGISPDPLLGLFEFDLWGRTAFALGVILLVVVFALLQRMARSPFGMLCRGVRQDPVRIASMGASVSTTLVKMYAISGAVAGVGGALSAIATQVVGLDSLSFTQSAESLVMLAPCVLKASVALKSCDKPTAKVSLLEAS